MKTETEAVKQWLWDADGETVIVALLASHHDDARLVHSEVVPLEEGVEVFDLGMESSSLLPLRFLPVLEES